MAMDDPASELLTDPYAVYARLRETAPVQRITGPHGSPDWIVTRYEDVRQALADPRLSLDKRHALPGSYRGFALPPALDANLLDMDPPDHSRIRRFVTQAFTARRIEKLRTPVRHIADDLLDAAAPPRPGGPGRRLRRTTADRRHLANSSEHRRTPAATSATGPTPSSPPTPHSPATTASEHRSPASKPASHSARCWSVSPGRRSTPPRASCAGGRPPVPGGSSR